MTYPVRNYRCIYLPIFRHNERIRIYDLFDIALALATLALPLRT